MPPRRPLDLTPHLSTPSYGSHPCQTVTLYHPPQASPTSLWVVFIHGGAWRDPRTTSTVALPLFSHLARLLPPSTCFASLNYRLSPHPEFPEKDPEHTARHPDHLNDVEVAVSWLVQTHQMDKWIVIGHSAGATLAFQMLEAKRIRPLPRLVVGVEGIYNLPSLVEEFGEYYKTFVEGAFPGGEEAWRKASPQGVAGYRGLVVIAHSDGDELVSWKQAEEWKEKVERTLGPNGGLRMVKLVGGHDEVLEGEKLVEVVLRYLGNVWRPEEDEG